MNQETIGWILLIALGLVGYGICAWALWVDATWSLPRNPKDDTWQD